MPLKRRRSASLGPAIPVTLRITSNGSIFNQTVIRKDWSVKKWRSITQSESVTHDSKEYHVGDLVVVRLEDDGQELAVIAEFREPYMCLVWVFETKSTKERRDIVGLEIASAYDLILSIYSDVAPLSAIISTSEKGILCKDYVFVLEPPQVITIAETRDGCFMGRLVEKIKARELLKGSATSLDLLSSAQPERDSRSSSILERDENGQPADLRHQDIRSPAPDEHFESQASDPATSSSTTFSPTATIRNSYQNPLTTVDSRLSSTTPTDSHQLPSSEEDSGEVNDTQLYNSTPSENSIATSSASFHEPPLPVRTVDGSMQSEDQKRSRNLLKQAYDQTTQSVLSALRDLRKSVKAEREQLPRHLEDGLVSFLGSFGSNPPVFDPEYLWGAGRVEDFSMPEDKHLLVTTIQTFQELSLREDYRMPKYILIKDLGQSSAMERHWKQTLLRFLGEHPQTEFEIQDVTNGKKLTFERKASEVYNRLSDDAPRSPILRQCRNSQDRIPWNLLNIHGGYLNTVGLRATEGIWRFGCLANLCERIEQPDLPSVGKHHEPKLGSSAFSGCLNFALLGERGSYSKAHVDLLGSTGIEILFGRKAWFLLDGDMTDEEKTEFALEGQDWQPSSERVKMVPLGPGDTLLMMPGHLSPHLVVTVETCLSKGGMFWDEFELARTLEHLWWIFQHPGATNEYIDQDVTKLIDAIQERRGSSASKAEKLKVQMWDKFSCVCMSHCGGPECGCFQQNDLRTVGCTSWCVCDC